MISTRSGWMLRYAVLPLDSDSKYCQMVMAPLLSLVPTFTALAHTAATVEFVQVIKLKCVSEAVFTPRNFVLGVQPHRWSKHTHAGTSKPGVVQHLLDGQCDFFGQGQSIGGVWSIKSHRSGLLTTDNF